MPAGALPPVHTHPWHDTRHHRPGGGFRHVWPGPHDDVPALKAAGWLLSFAFRRKPDQRPAPLRPLDPAALAAPPGRLRLTWLGHSTALLQLGPHTLLTDPVFADRASPLPFAGPKREVPLPLAPAALPPVDLVLLSHDHYDHLDLDAVAWLDARDRPLFLAPLGVGRRLGAARVLELDWGQYVEAHGLRLHCAPAKHFSGRTPFDRDRTLWASWYVEPLDAALPRVYYAGDTAYAGHFADVRARLGAPEVVLMPVGAYEPRWFMARVHVTPEEALQGFEDLGGRHLVPVHWGTFDLADDALDAPARVLPGLGAARGLTGALRVLPVGGSLDL